MGRRQCDQQRDSTRASLGYAIGGIVVSELVAGNAGIARLAGDVGAGSRWCHCGTGCRVMPMQAALWLVLPRLVPLGWAEDAIVSTPLLTGQVQLKSWKTLR